MITDAFAKVAQTCTLSGSIQRSIDVQGTQIYKAWCDNCQKPLLISRENSTLLIHIEVD